VKIKHASFLISDFQFVYFVDAVIGLKTNWCSIGRIVV